MAAFKRGAWFLDR